MASGNGLSSGSVKIRNFVTVDLIAGVRIDETILFVSLRESLEGKTSLSSDIFIYPKKVKSSIKSDRLKSLQSKNPLIGISGILEKKINFKKSIQDFFGLSYIPEVASKSIVIDSTSNITSVIEQLDRTGFKDDSISKLNSNMRKANISLIRVIKQGDNKNKNLFVTNYGVLHFDDFKNFVSNSKVSGSVNEKLYLHNTDLPRIASPSFFRSLLNQKGNITSDFGTMCWNLDNKLDLYSNIEYSVTRKIIKINFTDFQDAFINKQLCSPDRFKEEDQIIGYFNEGVFQDLTPEILDKEKSIQETYYTENVKKIKKDTLTSYLKLKYRRFFNYPKPSLPLFVVRENPILPFFDKLQQKSGSIYISGFYETLDPVKMRKVDFSFNNLLKREILDYVMRRYVRNNRLTIKNPTRRDEVREILIEIEKDINIGYPRKKKGYKNEFVVTREDYIKLIENLTGVVDRDGTALKIFFKDPSIFYGTIDGTQYENLRYISYFILCEENESCNLAKEISPGSGIESMDILQNVPGGNYSAYKMYYNTKVSRFNNIEV